MFASLRFLLLFALVVLPGAMAVMGQPPVGGPPPCWPPPCVPIDGGVGFLIAAGALLGGRQALALRRQRRS